MGIGDKGSGEREREKISHLYSRERRLPVRRDGSAYYGAEFRSRCNLEISIRVLCESILNTFQRGC